MKSFEWRLENLRDKHGYTKKEVSKILGFSQNTYGHYENGERTPDNDTIIKLAKLYQVSVNHLLTGEETPEHQNWNDLLSIYKEHGIDKPLLMDKEALSTLDEESMKKLIHYFESLVKQMKK